jgi:FkbM family methyltransferase
MPGFSPLSRLTRYAQRGLIRNHDIASHFLPDRYAAYRFAGGRIFLNIKESPMMLMRAFGLYEPQKMEIVSKLLKSGSTFIDVGGNKGDFALLAARKAGESGKVLCIEPEPNNCLWIRRSVELNGYRNVTLFELALSDTNGEANLYLGQKSGFHTLLGDLQGQHPGVITVRTTTLDYLLSQLHLERVDMIKIDVEGAELQVLKGAQRTLCQNPSVILLMDLHPMLGVNSAEVSSFLLGLGFSIYRMKAPFNDPLQPDRSALEVLAYRGRLEV